METLAASWWLWVLLGLVLLAGELLTPGGFYIFFFGIGAIVVGVLKLAGLPMGLAVEGIVFVAISVLALAFFRRPLMQKFNTLSPGVPVDELTREIAVALEPIAPRALGKVELRGTSWSAQNLGDQTIQKSARCSVVRVDGLKLEIRALET